MSLIKAPLFALLLFYTTNLAFKQILEFGSLTKWLKTGIWKVAIEHLIYLTESSIGCPLPNESNIEQVADQNNCFIIIAHNVNLLKVSVIISRSKLVHHAQLRKSSFNSLIFSGLD